MIDLWDEEQYFSPDKYNIYQIRNGRWTMSLNEDGTPYEFDTKPEADEHIKNSLDLKQYSEKLKLEELPGALEDSAVSRRAPSIPTSAERLKDFARSEDEINLILDKVKEYNFEESEDVVQAFAKLLRARNGEDQAYRWQEIMDKYKAVVIDPRIKYLFNDIVRRIYISDDYHSVLARTAAFNPADPVHYNRKHSND